MITYKQLSTPLKIGVCAGWTYLIFLLVEFISTLGA